MSFSWTQPVCEKHWALRNPGRKANRIREQYRDDETCCECGQPTRSGIYIRVDPTTVPHPTREK